MRLSQNTNTYSRMVKINELATELVRELAAYINFVEMDANKYIALVDPDISEEIAREVDNDIAIIDQVTAALRLITPEPESAIDLSSVTVEKGSRSHDATE